MKYLSWNQELKNEPYAMGNYTYDIYSRLIRQFESNYPNFKKHRSPGSKIEEEIAGEIFYYFPSHYYKLIATLLKCQQNTDVFRNLLNFEKVIILDLGSGIGTTIYAFLDVCRELQHNIKEIHFIFVEPCAVRNKIREQNIVNYISLIPDTIKITYENIEGCFPECQPDILNGLSTKSYGYGLLVVMSNFLSWIEPKDKLMGIFKGLRNSIPFVKKYESTTAKVISNIILESMQDEIFLINIENRKDSYLKEYYKQLDTKIIRIIEPPKKAVGPIKITNPENLVSIWGKKIYSLHFFFSIAKIICYVQKIKDSFFAVRLHYRAEMFPDEIGIKLFSSNFEQYVYFLSKEIRAGYKYFKDILELTIRM